LIKLTALLLVLLVTLFSAIFLFALSSKVYKNRFFLGLVFLSSFLVFVGNFLSFFEFWNLYKHFDFVFLGALLAFYPFYYLYLNSAFNIKVISTKWIYHFIPSFIITIVMFLVSSLSSFDNYQEYMNHILYNTNLTDQTAKTLTYIYDGSRYFHLFQIVAYNFLAIHFILKAKKTMVNSFSNLDHFQLRYFYIVTISFILLMSIPGFYITYIGRTPFVGNKWSLFYISLIFTVLYLILAIVGLKQISVEVNLTNLNKTTYSTTEIIQEELKLIEVNLIKYFQKEQPWLNPNLSIWGVAKHIGTNRSYVSKIINDNIGCNFNQFVNNYRLDEAKKLLKQQPELQITEISELSGFGSLNSFIRIFKINEKCTPTLFRKNNR